MIALRLVIDTNILVSAALKPDGLERIILTLALARPARLYVTDAIVAEYHTVLARPNLRIRKGLQRQLLQMIKNKSHLIHAPSTLQVSMDPGDNKFLECAEAARADYLISGNQRHFPRFWRSTKIITSREFISIVAPHLNP